MRKAQVQFTCENPSRRYRHEKPDLKTLLEKKDESYVDVSSVSWHVARPEKVFDPTLDAKLLLSQYQSRSRPRSSIIYYTILFFPRLRHPGLSAQQRLLTSPHNRSAVLH